jgi:hypothetical protein
MNEATQSTEPVTYRCTWCLRRLRRESPGYWWSCPDPGHPSSHDPRRRGPRATWHAVLARLLRR